MSVQRIIDEFRRWRSYGYSDKECLDALRKRQGVIESLGSKEEIDQAYSRLSAHKALEKKGVGNVLYQTLIYAIGLTLALVVFTVRSIISVKQSIFPPPDSPKTKPKKVTPRLAKMGGNRAWMAYHRSHKLFYRVRNYIDNKTGFSK